MYRYDGDKQFFNHFWELKGERHGSSMKQNIYIYIYIFFKLKMYSSASRIMPVLLNGLFGTELTNRITARNVLKFSPKPGKMTDNFNGFMARFLYLNFFVSCK